MLALRTVILMAALAGCASQGTVTQTGGTTARLPPASTWALGVTGCPEASQCEELRSVLLGQLISSGLARTVIPPGSGAELALDLRVSNLRAVPTAVRVLFGVMAGRNEVASTATVRNPRTGAVLRSFEIKSESASHPFSGESMEVDAYKKLAAQTVEALRP